MSCVLHLDGSSSNCMSVVVIIISLHQQQIRVSCKVCMSSCCWLITIKNRPNLLRNETHMINVLFVSFTHMRIATVMV